ncbi:(deoxy)nucleoside triphosphate pyrophosphohydrolase [Winogradskyella aurantiaca]|uniref:(deoxy)nucleoside triphosphate pyrophosphohydrolase n=1 Tax=Winogradskyella aurantiaca TaxID=2219558 RepID=UPI000E1D335D|nr:(deoxy)nucleoside triphosphate pyrophosphohydrolase [Winogradskyella aurantiaca]
MQQSPITVICGLIRNHQNQYFLARRAAHKDHAGFWEFPGGKLEPNETHQACLKRELMEELGMEVRVGLQAGDTHHDFENFSIHLVAYHCDFVSAIYQLSDHDHYEWVPASKLLDYRLAASDVALARLLMS